MTNGLQKCLLVLLVLAVSSLTAFSQGGASTGSIAGTVMDPKGAVVAGATVTVRSVATNQESTTQTSGMARSVSRRLQLASTQQLLLLLVSNSQ
jgi:hypothetical protein